MYFLNDDNINGIRLFWLICQGGYIDIIPSRTPTEGDLGRNSFGCPMGTVSVDGKIVVLLHIPYSIRKLLRYITRAPGCRRTKTVDACDSKKLFG
ncbi:unnamed protein product [Rhizophagus irregularis]|nr:unnamed protein product [Rhizophagus irregularis]